MSYPLSPAKLTTTIGPSPFPVANQTSSVSGTEAGFDNDSHSETELLLLSPEATISKESGRTELAKRGRWTRTRQDFGESLSRVLSATRDFMSDQPSSKRTRMTKMSAYWGNQGFHFVRLSDEGYGEWTDLRDDDFVFAGESSHEPDTHVTAADELGLVLPGREDFMSLSEALADQGMGACPPDLEGSDEECMDRFMRGLHKADGGIRIPEDATVLEFNFI